MKLFVPDAVVPSVVDLDLADLKRRGIAGLLIDIDNTLVPWGNPQMDERLAEWIGRAKAAGFKICLVSNACQSACRLCPTVGHPCRWQGHEAAEPGLPQGYGSFGSAPQTGGRCW